MSHSTGNLWKPVTFVLELSEINSEGFVEFYSSSHFDGTQGFVVWRGANLHLVDLNFQIKDNVDAALHSNVISILSRSLTDVETVDFVINDQGYVIDLFGIGVTGRLQVVRKMFFFFWRI